MNKVLAIAVVALLAACSDRCTSVVDGTETEVACDVETETGSDTATATAQ